MKIRTGFVSNSSSSSFIIMAEGNFSTVRSVAEYIINEQTQFSEDNRKLEILNNLDPDTPVYFSTWEDDTYIHKIDDKIIVQTSQNLDLKYLRERCISANDLTEEFYKQFNYKDEEYENEYIYDNPRDFSGYYHNLNDFVNLNQGNGKLVGSHTYIYDCPKCGFTLDGFHCKTGLARLQRAWKLKSGKKICKCEIDNYLKIISRKEKINKINENT
jgi:hypothetical protein